MSLGAFPCRCLERAADKHEDDFSKGCLTEVKRYQVCWTGAAEEFVRRTAGRKRLNSKWSQACTAYTYKYLYPLIRSGPPATIASTSGCMKLAARRPSGCAPQLAATCSVSLPVFLLVLGAVFVTPMGRAAVCFDAWRAATCSVS